MNGSEVRSRTKEVFEKKDATQHQKLDALYLLILYNSDTISEYVWLQVPVRIRGPLKVGVAMWALVVSVASIERIWSFIQNLLV